MIWAWIVVAKIGIALILTFFLGVDVIDDNVYRLCLSLLLVPLPAKAQVLGLVKKTIKVYITLACPGESGVLRRLLLLHI